MRTIMTFLLSCIAVCSGAQTKEAQDSVRPRDIIKNIYIIEKCNSGYINPVKRIEPPKGRRVFSSNDLKIIPVTTINEIAALYPGVYQRKRGEEIYSEGGRPGGNLYIIDGIRILRFL